MMQTNRFAGFRYIYSVAAKRDLKKLIFVFLWSFDECSKNN